MKRIPILVLTLTILILYSCSSKSSETGESFEGYVSNAVRTPTTLDGKPIPEKKEKATNESSESSGQEEASESSGGIDTDAPSDSKGVGEFTDVEIGEGIDDALASKGKELFQTSCTACHTATDKKLIGPGLKGITKIRTPEWIMNMIDNPIEMTQKDPIAKALKEELNGVQMTPMGLNKDQVRAVLEYLRQNDG